MPQKLDPSKPAVRNLRPLPPLHQPLPPPPLPPPMPAPAPIDDFNYADSANGGGD